MDDKNVVAPRSGAVFMTRADLKKKEDAQDHEALLSEEWYSYAQRKKLPVVDQHVKAFTETWDDFEARKVAQAYYFKSVDLFTEQRSIELADAAILAENRSDAVVKQLMDAEALRKAALLQPRHFLCVDYSDYQQFLFSNQRQFVEGEETLLRKYIKEIEDEFLFSLAILMHRNHRLNQARETERIENEEAAKRRIESEYLQKMKEEKELEAQLSAQKREAAQAEKERAEVEKRLERKRRDEERRAKARAEREQRKI